MFIFQRNVYNCNRVKSFHFISFKEKKWEKKKKSYSLIHFRISSRTSQPKERYWVTFSICLWKREVCLGSLHVPGILPICPWEMFDFFYWAFRNIKSYGAISFLSLLWLCNLFHLISKPQMFFTFTSFFWSCSNTSALL